MTMSKEQNVDACEISPTQGASSFRELYDDMQKDTYWIRFFCRPCCPDPKLDGAIEMLDKLADEVRASADFDDEEKAATRRAHRGPQAVVSQIGPLQRVTTTPMVTRSYERH